MVLQSILLGGAHHYCKNASGSRWLWFDIDCGFSCDTIYRITFAPKLLNASMGISCNWSILNSIQSLSETAGVVVKQYFTPIRDPHSPSGTFFSNFMFSKKMYTVSGRENILRPWQNISLDPPTPSALCVNCTTCQRIIAIFFWVDDSHQDPNRRHFFGCLCSCPHWIDGVFNNFRRYWRRSHFFTTPISASFIPNM